MPLPVSGEILTATDLTNMFPTNIDAWSTYTPTWTQSATISKTVSRAAYMRIGRLCVVNVALVATSAGTANNAMRITIPVTAATASGAMGSFWFNDAGTSFYSGVVYMDSSTTVIFVNGGATTNFMGVTGGGFAAAVASTDTLTALFAYETAS